ncbi:P-loop containing nucleoside triphosphate hydrolase protein [Biscogniauxia sp. FL1348]|nr:P-loop containing nucleoside triphosphate hydrolase protein [Biscogniauxia sp. FL1348]
MASGVGNNDPAEMTGEMAPISDALRSHDTTSFESLFDEENSSGIMPTNVYNRTEGANESLFVSDYPPEHYTDDGVISADDENASVSSGVEISERPTPNNGSTPIHSEGDRFDSEQASPYSTNTDPNRDHRTNAHEETGGIFNDTYLDYIEYGQFNESKAGSVTNTGMDSDKAIGESLTDYIMDEDEQYEDNDSDSIQVDKKKQVSRKKTGPRAKTAKEWFAKKNPGGIKKQKRQKEANQSIGAMLNSLQNNPVEARIARGHIPEAEQITAKTKTSQLEQILNQVPENISKRTVASDKKKLIEASRSFGYGNCVAQDGKWLIKGMKTSLHAHQVIASSWMLGREFSHDEPDGGILADEMGMGKTLEILGCVVSNPPPDTFGKPDNLEKRHKATLIIAPASAIKQWESEIKKHVENTHIEGVLIFKQSQELPETVWENVDIILASYHEISRQFPSKKAQARLETRKYSDDMEKKEKFNELLGPLLKTRFWRVVLDESHMIKNEKSQMSQACHNLRSEFRWSISGTPITNSVDELFPHLKFLVPGWNHDLKYFEHLFDEHTDFGDGSNECNIIKNYDTTSSDSFMGQPLYTIPLCYQEFLRIQLNEEERVIYNVLEIRYREIMNEKLEKGAEKVGCYLELLLRLRQAIAHPFLLETTLKQTLRVSDILEIQTRLKEVGGEDSAFKQIQNWCEEVTTEIDNGHANGLSDSQIALNVGRFGYEWNMAKHLNKVLTSKNVSLCRICIQEPELPQHAECGHLFCKECIDQHMLGERQSGKQLLLCPECFKPLIGLKALIEGESEESESISSNLSVFGSHSYTSGSSQDMVAFYEQFHHNITSNTREPLGKDGKRLGRDFLDVQVKLNKNTSTFLIECDKTYPKPIVPSAKTTAAMEAVLNWQADAPDDKIIIFTDFKMTGAILGRMLQAQGIHFLYFYGDMVAKQKHNAIQAFHDQKEVKVLIASLKCGGVALNLTCANRVILVDLWWNCAVELQAFARAFRMGQKKETYFLRIVAQNTIDNRIEALQGTKLLNINKVMESGSRAQQKLTHDQALSLFGKVQVNKDGSREIVADYTT